MDLYYLKLEAICQALFFCQKAKNVALLRRWFLLTIFNQKIL